MDGENTKIECTAACAFYPCCACGNGLGTLAKMEAPSMIDPNSGVLSCRLQLESDFTIEPGCYNPTRAGYWWGMGVDTRAKFHARIGQRINSIKRLGFAPTGTHPPRVVRVEFPDDSIVRVYIKVTPEDTYCLVVGVRDIVHNLPPDPPSDDIAFGPDGSVYAPGQFGGARAASRLANDAPELVIPQLPGFGFVRVPGAILCRVEYGRTLRVDATSEQPHESMLYRVLDALIRARVETARTTKQPNY